MDNRLINNRYNIIKTLGKGSMGEVFLAEDKLYDNALTAIKLINNNTITDINITYLKKEFDVMTRLKHPNLIRVYDFGKDVVSNSYFIAMEYLEGGSLTSHIKRLSCDRDRVIKVFIQILRALSFIHSRNIVHRDIKPDNIMFTDHTIKVMDFGLADLENVEKKTKGTLIYMAPEVIKKQIDYRVDIFAAGIIFYQLLTNSLFYEEGDTTSVVNLLIKEKEFEIFRSVQLDRIGDNRIKEIVRKMLHFDRDKRYQHCSEIFEALNSALQMNHTQETYDTKKAYVLGAAFVGRQQELTVLTDRVTAADPQALLIHGEAGVGKSRLMGEFKKYCQLHDITYLEGNCYQHTTRMYAPLLAILSESLLQVPHSIIEQYGPELKKLLPEHEILAEITINETYDPKVEKERLSSAIVGFLLAYIENRDNPVVIYINDSQWSDDESLGVIKKIISTSKRQDRENELAIMNTLSIYVTSREEGLERVENILDGDNYSSIRLRPFAAEHVVRYVHSTFGKDQVGTSLNNQIPAINKRVGGNPFYLQELIKSLVESGYLDRKLTGWELEKEVENIDIPDQLSGLIELRLNRLDLSPERMYVLQVLALLDRSISRQELASICPVDHQFLNTLETNEILKTTIFDELVLYNFSHDLIKETLVANLTDRHLIHGKIAQGLETIHSTDSNRYIDELAYHYYLAGNDDKSRIYLEKAGDIARTNFLNTRAITLYNQLLSLIDNRNPDKQAEILLKMHEPYRIIGKYDEFLEVGDKVIRIAEKTGNEKQLARAHLNLGKYHSLSMNIETSFEHLEDAFTLFQKLNDKKGLLYTYNYLGGNNIQLRKFDKAICYLKKSRKVAQEIGDKEGLAYCTGNMGFVLDELGEYEKAAEYYRIATNLGKSLGNKEFEIIGYSNLGHIYNITGDYDKAREFLDIGLKMCMEIELGFAKAVILSTKAITLFLMGKIDEAEQLNNDIRPVLIENNVVEELLLSHALTAEILTIRGKQNEAVSLLKELLSKEDDEHNIAFLNYELWKVTKSESYKTVSLALYKKLYAQVPMGIYKRHMDDMERNSNSKRPLKRNFY